MLCIGLNNKSIAEQIPYDAMTAKNTDDNPTNPRSGWSEKTEFIRRNIFFGKFWKIFVYLLIDTIKASEHEKNVHINDWNSPHQSGNIGADRLIWQVIESPCNIDKGLEIFVFCLVPQL